MTSQTPFGGVALTGRAPALHAGGWRFESARLHHLESIYRWMLQSGKSSVRRTPLKEAFQLGAPSSGMVPQRVHPDVGFRYSESRSDPGALHAASRTLQHAVDHVFEPVLVNIVDRAAEQRQDEDDDEREERDGYRPYQDQQLLVGQQTAGDV
jgi:hypothetical protein